MNIKVLFLIALFALVAPALMAQDDGEVAQPTIAFLNSQVSVPFQMSELAVVEALAAAGYLTQAEGAALRSAYFASWSRPSPSEPDDLMGERVNLIWADAGGDLSLTGVMVDAVLDQQPDVLITLTDRVTLAALNETSDMEEPPAIIFVVVYNADLSGIAQASCIKPSHVTGVESIAPYDEIMSLLRLQKPDLKVIGTIYSLPDASSAFGAERITEIGEAMGLTVMQEAVTQFADLRAAASSLLDEGIEMLVLPVDVITGPGLPIVMSVAEEYDVPVLYSHIVGSYYATIGAGSRQAYVEGRRAGEMLVGYLNGEIDIAETGTISLSSFGIGLNYDAAARQGIEFAEALVEAADMTVRNGRPDFPSRNARVGLFSPDPGMEPLDLASLHCTDEMIAAQQAELDAAE